MMLCLAQVKRALFVVLVLGVFTACGSPFRAKPLSVADTKAAFSAEGINLRVLYDTRAYTAKKLRDSLPANAHLPDNKVDQVVAYYREHPFLYLLPRHATRDDPHLVVFIYRNPQDAQTALAQQKKGLREAEQRFSKLDGKTVHIPDPTRRLQNVLLFSSTNSTAHERARAAAALLRLSRRV